MLRRRLLVMLALLATAAGIALLGAGTANASATYKVRAGFVGLAIRQNNGSCVQHPSTANCPPTGTKVSSGAVLTVFCQKQGQTVGSNPYWLYLETRSGVFGWLPSWYIDYPANRLPNVPNC
jgi:hypothetical protein